MQPAGFYIYAHHRNDSGALFYVGKGTGKRAWTIRSSGRNPHWQNIVRKHGRTVRIVADGLDEELAFLGEVELIDKLRRLGADLTNTTEGGEGATITDPAAKQRHRESIKAALARPEVRERLSASIRAGLADPAVRARRNQAISAAWSRPEARARKSAASKAAAAGRRTAVLCASTGARFASMADAAAWLRENGWPKATPSKICLACSGARPAAYGFTWQYANEET